MLKKALIFAALFIILSLSFNARALSAKAYAEVDQASGRLICGNNVDMRLPMASTTKIMTALIACESGDLNKTVTVSAEAIHVEGSSMGLQAGEHITLRDLVYGLLLDSGNDAANEIAIDLGGSIPGFAKIMNRRAQQLGLNNTNFVNPSGLDANGHYTTALDLARLGAVAMKNPDFAKIAGTKKFKITFNGIKNGRTLYNHNKLLGNFDGITGIKTGFTKKSGRCLVTSATRNGVSLVVATLNDPNDWNDSKQLLNYGFGLLKNRTLFDGSYSVNAQVVGGQSDTVSAVFDGEVSAALSDPEVPNVTMEPEMPSFIYAPVRKGQKLGELVFKVNGEIVAQADLTAAKGIPKKMKVINSSQGGGILIIVLAFSGALALFFTARFLDGRSDASKRVRR